MEVGGGDAEATSQGMQAASWKMQGEILPQPLGALPHATPSFQLTRATQPSS